LAAERTNPQAVRRKDAADDCAFAPSILIDIPSFLSGSCAIVGRVNQSLRDLRAQLGAPLRFQIDAEPNRRKRPVIVTVRWRCGCTATGTGLDRLDAAGCAQHRLASAPPRVPARTRPLLGTLLGRP
jgi:hypothetical protein